MNEEDFKKLKDYTEKLSKLVAEPQLDSVNWNKNVQKLIRLSADLEDF